MQTYLMLRKCFAKRLGTRHAAPSAALVVVLLLLLAQTASATEPLRSFQPRKGKPLVIEEISLIEGDTIGGAGGKYVKKDNPSLPRPPTSSYIHCEWDGSHLRIYPGQVSKSMWSKHAIAKAGWYISADYTKTPPRVIVTEKPTAGSNWRFVDANKGRERYYIKNVGPSGKEGWLTFQTRKEIYRVVERVPASPPGNYENRYKEVTVSDAVLTFDAEKKKVFGVVDVEEDGGK